MTVASALNRKTFAGDDATTSFATTPVKFFDTSDLLVYVTNDTTGVATLKTEDTHYTVSGGDTSAGAVGTVSLAGGSSPHGALLSGTTLVIVRELPLLQGVDFVQNDASNAEVAEAALDKIVLNLQRLSDQLDRALVVSDGDVSGADFTVPTPSANTFLGWSSSGLALTNYVTTDLSAVAVAAFTLDIITAADEDEFFQTMVDGMTAETAPAIGDLIAISDISLTPDDGRKMTLANMLAVVNGLTADSAPDTTNDYILTYDTSAGAAKKATPALLGVPVGAMMPYAGTAAPTGWLLCYGQAVSQATYAALYAILGTTYGSDAGGNFTLPDLRGRVVAGQDDMGGVSADRLTDQSGGLDGDTLGDTGGAETHTLVDAEMPTHDHSFSFTRSNTPGSTANVDAPGGGVVDTFASTTGTAGSDAAHNNVQPTIILNYIIKT